MATLSLPLSQNTLFLPYSSSKRRRFLSQDLLYPPIKIITCSAKRDQVDFFCSMPLKELQTVACGLLAAWAVTAASPVIAASQRLPPLSTEPNRCEKAFVGNTIALMSDAKFDGADMSEVVMSKAYAVGASFKGVDFSNAVLDRVNFGKANLQGAVFKNAVLSGSTFDEAQLADAVFEDTIIGYIDLQKLCTNTTVDSEGRASLGCR
ncbi:thylakoid lumenal 17.4 kDa protein, chloroplastic isoform X2 [Hevea brasiliensis]|uniref:thylakoid lumenal 17.4 kDa protein, chloroplastic isoform X2 n=1 Tax=Hevea brasiliensis TaxID=3981 RepID=UPI0025FE708C|nr:thylakoid lumenal 17.4 kDa protein, chloroplastic isoform X2 [Hevea brasiliensis]